MLTTIVDILQSPFNNTPTDPKSHTILLETYLTTSVMPLLVGQLRVDAGCVCAAVLLNRLVQGSAVAGEQLVAAGGLEEGLLARYVGGCFLVCVGFWCACVF